MVVAALYGNCSRLGLIHHLFPKPAPETALIFDTVQTLLYGVECLGDLFQVTLNMRLVCLINLFAGYRLLVAQNQLLDPFTDSDTLVVGLI
jgi:hypothetical protein